MKSLAIVAGLLLGGAAAAAHCGAPIPPYVTQALADPLRPPAQLRLDPARKPGEVIAFSGLKPGDEVADFMPGNAYFTRIFSRIVGPLGHVYALLPTQQLAHCAPDEVAGTLAVEQDRSYANVTVLRAPAGELFQPLSLDLVWLSLDYHDLHDQFMQPTDVQRFNAAVFRALKRGGIYLIIDHAAAPGTGLRDTETLHRIDPGSIRSEVLAAGFVLAAESEVLRNRQDTHRLAVFDPAIRYRTDQVVFKFRKP